MLSYLSNCFMLVPMAILKCDIHFCFTCDCDNNVLRSALRISRLCGGALDLCSHILCLSWLSLCCRLSLTSSCRLLSGDGCCLITGSSLACGSDNSGGDHSGLNFSQKLRGSWRSGAGIRLPWCDSNTSPLGLCCRLDLTHVAWSGHYLESP